MLGEPDEDAGVTCLSEQQQRALDLAERGYSMFLTGSAGTGKSFVLRQMIERLRLKHGPEAVAVTASTGTSRTRTRTSDLLIVLSATVIRLSGSW